VASNTTNTDSQGRKADIDKLPLRIRSLQIATFANKKRWRGLSQTFTTFSLIPNATRGWQASHHTTIMEGYNTPFECLKDREELPAGKAYTAVIPRSTSAGPLSLPRGTMNYFVNTRWGGSEPKPSVDRMREVLAELDGDDDDEHPNVSLTHESEWTLSAFPDGLVIWENAEADVARHMLHVSRVKVLDLWIKLSLGQIEAIEQEPWLAGYG
jgi:hypothetical protein